jgi:hypothetical protein
LSSWLGEKAVRTRFGLRNGDKRNPAKSAGPINKQKIGKIVK